MSKKLIRVADNMIKWYNNDEKASITEYLINEGFEKNYISYLVILSEKEISGSEFNYNEEIKKNIVKLYQSLISKQINLIKKKIQEAEKKADEKELQKMEEILNKKINQLSHIK